MAAPKSESLDIVYICRPGDDNEELRHSLRSLKNLPHGKVWIVGEAPAWVRNVELIRVLRGRDKQASALANLVAACQHPDISDPFVVMNDDFYILEPIPEIPTMHMGDLDQVIADHRPGTAYRNAMQKTRDRIVEIFAKEGIDRPLYSYELHAPMVIDKLGMLLALSLATDIHGVHNRTLYGNLMKRGGTYTPDVKVYRSDKRQSYTYGGSIFLSTSDNVFRYHPVGRYIREKLSEPCEYEWIGKRSREAVRYKSLVYSPH